MKYIAPLSALILMSASPVWAGESCQSAKDMVKMAQNFYAAEDALTNIITPKVSLQMEAINGAPAPDGIHYFYNDIYAHLPVDEASYVQNLETAVSWSKDGKLCRMLDGEIAPESEKDTVRVNVIFRFEYKRDDGVFTLDEILEGAKDGSKIMNSLAPKGLGFAVPSLKSIQVHPTRVGTESPEVIFLRKNKPVDVSYSVYNGSQLIRLKDLKSAKVDEMKITGEYDMLAGFKFDPDDIEQSERNRLAKLEVNAD